MRQSTPILNEGNLGAEQSEGQCAPAESATELGADDDLNLPFFEVARTLLLVIVVVSATALIAALI